MRARTHAHTHTQKNNLSLSLSKIVKRTLLPQIHTLIYLDLSKKRYICKPDFLQDELSLGERERIIK